MKQTLRVSKLDSPLLPQLSPELQAALTEQLHNKTKPRGSLGMLEELAMQIGLVHGTTAPSLDKVAALVFAGDHGIAAEGVSAFPQAVTRQMVQTFQAGNAAINVLCRANRIDLTVVDCGVIGGEFLEQKHPTKSPVLSKRAGNGTKSCVTENALTKGQLQECWKNGKELARQLLEQGYSAAAFGEMGIGNTSIAALLTHFITDIPMADCVGRGTGLNDPQLTQKVTLLTSLAARCTFASMDDLLLRFGGFEVITMASTMLHFAAGRGMVIVDGFISTAAFLISHALQPALKDFCVLSLL
jgi:nicotinate-nucleotide--dimethylbenzimidazole phosphoribosyltransferase